MDPPETSFFDIPTDIVESIVARLPAESLDEVRLLSSLRESNIWYRSGLDKDVTAARHTVESYLNWKFLPYEYKTINWIKMAAGMTSALRKTSGEITPDTIRSKQYRHLSISELPVLAGVLRIFFRDAPTSVVDRYLADLHRSTIAMALAATGMWDLYKSRGCKLTDVAIRRLHTIITLIMTTSDDDPGLIQQIDDVLTNLNQYDMALMLAKVTDAKTVNYLLDIDRVSRAVNLPWRDIPGVWTVELAVKRGNTVFFDTLTSHPATTPELIYKHQDIWTNPICLTLLRSSRKYNIIPFIDILKKNAPALYYSKEFLVGVLAICNADVISHIDEQGNTLITYALLNSYDRVFKGQDVTYRDIMLSNKHLSGKKPVEGEYITLSVMGFADIGKVLGVYRFIAVDANDATMLLKVKAIIINNRVIWYDRVYQHEPTDTLRTIARDDKRVFLNEIDAMLPV